MYNCTIFKYILTIKNNSTALNGSKKKNIAYHYVTVDKHSIKTLKIKSCKTPQSVHP